MPQHIVCFFFQMQQTLKLYHWTTNSFARHSAADKLYDELVETSDEFMETYMGKYGRPTKLGKRDLTFEINALHDGNVNGFLDDCIKYLTVDITKFLKPTDTDLLNIRDDLIGKINKTKYLFTLH